MATKSPAKPEPRAGTGVAGLDDVMGGGYTPHRLYLLEGVPGSGKTTLAMQFLLEGVRQGERVLYVTLSETEAELRAVAESHGWSLDGIEIRELAADEGSLQSDDQYTMFHPSEVELGETTKKILADVERIKPTRVVFDSLSELRLLAGNALRYRRQILALKQFFNGRNCTVLLLDDMTSANHDLQVQSIANGVTRLELMYPEYGAERRRLIVVKFRGVRFRGGYHDYVVNRGGLEVFPRLVSSEHRVPVTMERLGSGIAELDALLGGGLERGTSTLVVGAAGTGKSTVGAQFAAAAAARGQRAALFIFDESRNTLLSRCTGLGIDLQKHVDSGLVSIQQIDPAELSPGEFAHAIRKAVEQEKVSVVMIDSLNGYLNAMPGERYLVIQLHELLTFLGQAGVASILVGAQHGLIGSKMTAPVDVSYLADAVVLMRYFESQGRVRQAISVVKKRGGAHERTIREFFLQKTGIVCICRATLEQICDEMDVGVGAIMVVEEAVAQDRGEPLLDWLAEQPPWSDVPVLVLARPGADSAAVAQAMDLLGNVTVLERPTRVAALVSAVRSALRARQRQCQIREHLAQAVRTQEQLRAADRRKDEFLAVLAHELRNPLAPIRNSLHILRLTSEHDPAVQRVGGMMERQVNHMVRLVDDLMEVSRISRGKIELRKEPVEVSAIVRSALETSRPLIDAAGHQLAVSLPPDLLTLDGDAVRLAQVFSNLLNNAAKYTDAGGQIWLTVRREGTWLVVSVRDTGTGISAEMLPRVFEMFTQVDRDAGRSQGGLGIGLSLVKRLVEMHGGTVQAKSAGRGQGSEFVVRLPLTLPQPAPEPVTQPVASMAVFPSRRVLVVDDNRDAAESLAALLKLLGADVRLAYDGNDALETLDAFSPHVVLLDIGMPNMDGYEVARRIRQRPDLSHVTLIALTGWGQEEARARSQSAGFDHHLIKPADVNALQTLLFSYDDHRR